MTGADAIVNLRRAGKKPVAVWVSTFPDAMLDGMTVRVAETDIPEALDLRFLVGLTAIVEGDNPARVDRIAKACQAHAKRVIASTHGGRKVVRVTDTEGVLSWN